MDPGVRCHGMKAYHTKYLRMNKNNNNNNSIFKEDNVFSTIDSLPYGPPVNTGIDYYRTFLIL